MLKKISNNIWKLGLDSNLYLLDFDQKIIIDTGDRIKSSVLKLLLPKLIALDKVEKVIFTHLHYDHIGNADLFPNAEFFASKQEIKDFKENPEFTVLDAEIIARMKFLDEKLKPMVNMNGLQTINTPGHTRGSICLWYEKDKVLFTGDTYFGGNIETGVNLCVGRTDLPTSISEEMKKSLEKVKKIQEQNKNLKLCPGHDYCGAD
ncbi:MBL fold metallo-hydrolase [Candidatus Woesearchaeota archaeon]|nr:MBL fold metallo-hydrolase [Candidatus Woesearchaeota archaeon]MBT5271840.1 MBL fold metallo-hydrolase [Candidatus Woesearchaeota archaeon]MBT6040292.1 MBL fold metallo-hydrolase [Candidatus Woesearchaeota archaeon]MBT6337328.1 MBL fold metallo-hydrolase [Candidatus Woesearchaeota archaeon]MBT7927576.1 MBL fold metallo-hydrolase [Candidatus Woesearchaeota archaeon]